MSHKKFCFIVAMLAALVAAPAQAIHIEFFQVDWMSDATPGAETYVSRYSDWGRVEIGLSDADDGLFHDMTLLDGTVGRGGFINIVTDSAADGTVDWNIMNLPIFYEDPAELNGRLPQGVLFDLGVTPGTIVSGFNINYDYSIDDTPQSAVALSTSTSATVGTFESLVGGDKLYMFGSLNEGGGASAPQAAQNFTGVKPGEQVATRASIAVPETSVAGVNEDKNGCAPGAVARSINYMSQANSNVNVPSSAQTVYGELRTDMGTTAAGTGTSSILSGKNKYVNRYGLPIVSTQTKNFQKAIETLKNKGDVEIGMSWGTGKGAHRAFVSEIQEVQDPATGQTTGYIVKTVDDSKQGDGQATNATHTARFDANGRLLQYDGKAPTGVGAGLINFQTENVHASTIVLEFPWGGSATYPVPPGGSIPTPIGSIPVGRPGTSVTLGGVRINFEGVTSPDVAVSNSLLVVGSQPRPEKGGMLAMDLDVQIDPSIPIPPEQISHLQVQLGLEHLVMPGDDQPHGQFLSVPSDENEYIPEGPDANAEKFFFLENMEVGGSFFDITYRVNTDDEPFGDDGYQVFCLHGEVAEEFLSSVWLVDLHEELGGELPPPDPDFPAESFFDVFFELELNPELDPTVYDRLAADLVTLFNMELTAVEVPDLLFGDANGDNVVNEEDAAALSEHWLCGEEGPINWADGDFSGDSFIDGYDATMLAINWLNEKGSPMAGVPEPAAIVLFAGMGLFLPLIVRRKRNSG